MADSSTESDAAPSPESVLAAFEEGEVTEPLTPQEVAGRCNVHPSTAMSVLADLEAEGRVEERTVGAMTQVYWPSDRIGERILAVFAELPDGQPLTEKEVAERVNGDRRSANSTLKKLVNRETLYSKDVGGGMGTKTLYFAYRLDM